MKFNLRINRNVKYTILNHVAKLEYGQFSQINHSDVLQRVNNDATVYADFFYSQLNLFLDTIFIVSFSVAQIFELNAVIGVFVLVICVFIVMLSIWYYKISKPLVEDTLDANQQIIEKTRDTVENSKMQKIFNRRNLEIENFQKVNEDYRKKDIKLGKCRTVYGIGTHTIRNFKEPVILLLGGIFVVQGKMTLATVSILLTLATKISDYIYDTVDKLKDVNQFLVAYRKLSNLMETKEDANEKQDKKLAGNIVFQNVTIKAGTKNILENINLEIKQGQNIAIVGDNGSGKTVFAKALMGFYEYEGDIFIGNTNLKEVSAKSIRNYIGIVLQDTYLFHDTILGNLNITNQEILECEMEQALKVADIYEDVQKMENGFNTILENGGDNLSGGQKQRLAIARNILANHEFIIFDDSLSKLDTRTKRNILENIITINKGMLIISHDSNVAQICDQVIFIHDKEMQMNTYAYFMENQPEYKQIIEMTQNKILENEE